MSRRQPPALPSLSRKPATRKPKVEFVIACEGTATEPYYLKQCIDYYGAGAVHLRILKQTGVPLTLVDLAIQERERLMENYRKTPEQYSYGFVVWAVFDRDIHPEYEQAIALAQKNNIMLAVSNPCFELWPYLHLSECGNHLHRHDMQAALAKVLPGYHHEKNPIIDFSRIAKNVDVAEKRASVLERDAEPFCNPTTGMHRLVRAVINNGKRQPIEI